MVTEDYVSFETAKLLKEKGFDYASFYCYEEKGINDILLVILSAPLSNSDLDNTIESHKCYSAPTLQMAMKWLREVHYYNIEIDTLGMMELNTLSWRSAVYYLVNENECYCKDGFDSYEEACEAAIKYCLENLI